MKRGYLVFLAVLSILIFVAGCGSKETSPTPQTETNEPLSEQPDAATFKEYFTEFYLAKMPVGQKLGESFPTRTTVYTPADQFCAMWTQLKVIPSGNLSTAIYDKGSGQYLRAKGAFPQQLPQGGNAGCEGMTFPLGKYEYKIYVNDKLTVVLPFEVK